jgi:glycosyltransferase involved in cell wall biosynthesis
MHIAMLAPIAWRVPPRGYGPWEQVVSTITEGLVRRGIEVTLFATADSCTSATLSAVCPRGYEEDPEINPKVWEHLHIASVFERAGEFDLIHNHFDYVPLTWSRLVDTPVVTTIHGFSSEQIVPVYQRYNGHTHYIAISNADRHPTLDYLATIYHGLALEQFTPRTEHGNYLLFFGRIHPDKGTAEAIETARLVGKRLVIAGIIHDQAYYEREVAPHIDGDAVTYLGPAGPEQRDRLLGGALALLHLVNFAEPFGLSMAEALACGTPVIGTPRGSVPEVVRHGIDGFIVETPVQAAEALAQVPTLDRAAISSDAASRFSAERMVDEYIRAYQEILQR